MTSAFLDALRERVVLGDGAMGTELLARGALSGRNLSLLNLENPELVLEVHRDYAAAGAELFRTNTFTANRLRMDPDCVREANLEGARLAREAAGSGRFVAGSIGPLGEFTLSKEERREVYRQQCRALVDGGCDALILETFGTVEDLYSAIDAAKESGVPIVAQTFVVGISIDGNWLGDAGAAVLGANCASFVDTLLILSIWKHERLGGVLSAFPNVGQPGQYETPRNFVETALQFVQLGVRLIGGCCGTTPAYIRALARRMVR